MTTDILPHTILIIAGLADPCGDIGTQCRYDLLPVPWDQAVFAKTIARAIEVDKWTAYIEEFAPHSHPVGVRCWICTQPRSQELLPLLEPGWNSEQENRIASLINRIATETPVAEFVWPGGLSTDMQTLAILERNLLKILNSYQAR